MSDADGDKLFAELLEDEQAGKRVWPVKEQTPCSRCGILRMSNVFLTGLMLRGWEAGAHSAAGAIRRSRRRSKNPHPRREKSRVHGHSPADAMESRLRPPAFPPPSSTRAQLALF